MKISVPRADLAPALNFVTRTVERRSTIPILSNVRLIADDDGLRFTATDLDAEASCKIPAQVDRPGALTAPAARLHDIIRKIDDKAIVSLSAENDTLTVKAGRAKFTLQTLPISDFPDIAAGELPHRFELPAALLARGLQKTAFATSTEETRYYLNGAYMHAPTTADARQVLRLVTTDGHRLARFETEAPPGAAGIPGVIVPRKACAEIVKMAKEAGKDAVASISLSKEKIRIEVGAATLLSKLIDGSYPDYARVIPTQNDKLANADREALARAVDRVATVSSERAGRVKLDFADGALTLGVVNPDMGSASEELEIDYSAAPLEIGFNAAYLREILGNFDGDRVEIALNDSVAPTILTSPGDADLLVVIMPMRI